MDLSRRDFMKTAVTGSLALGSAGLLSSCGINTADISTAVHRASGPPKRGGTLRAAITGGSSADTLDPLSSVSNADFTRVNNLFEPLLGLTPQAQPVFVLADELTPNATATEWTLRLKSGITFHNGKGRHHRLQRPDQPGERAPIRAGRRCQPAVCRRDRGGREPGKEHPDL